MYATEALSQKKRQKLSLTQEHLSLNDQQKQILVSVVRLY